VRIGSKAVEPSPSTAVCASVRRIERRARSETALRQCGRWRANIGARRGKQIESQIQQCRCKQAISRRLDSAPGWSRTSAHGLGRCCHSHEKKPICSRFADGQARRDSRCDSPAMPDDGRLHVPRE
jgi:hypothetical protein